MKAILLDLDGTCLTSDYRISDELCAFIMNIKSDISVHIVTGRAISDALRYQRQLNLNSEMICYNGGVIFDYVTKRIKNRKNMKNAQVILQMLRENYEQWGIENIVVSSGDETYVLNQNNEYLCDMLYDRELPFIRSSFTAMSNIDVVHRIVLSVLPEKREWLTQLINDLFMDVIAYGWAGRNEIIDISLRNVDKWDAVAELLLERAICRDEVLAYGDGMSDLNMLQNVGVGVGMCNGPLGLMRGVRHVTKYDNNNNGVYFDIMERI